MASLAERLINLQNNIGGFYQKTGFEHTFGPTRQTTSHITPPNPEIYRIMGQLEFAVKLSGVNKGKFDTKIDKALKILEYSLEKQGVLTRDACVEAEQAILPLKKASREYVVICAAHAHIDMNWQWGWQETVASTLATFRTMLTLMNEYPDFTFSQSQAAVYHITEEYDPELMKEIKKRIKEGRWEVTASAWVETDKNMPNTESLIRHIKYTRDYLTKNWGVNPASLNIDFSPDTFGHSAHIPEINNYGNVKYFYHCRGFDERHVLYRWKSASGSEILGHCEPFWYNSGINAEIGVGVTELASLCAGLKTSLIVYGVGDHGGGPTRKDIEQIIEMADWPVFPTIKFGTFGEYFKAAETVREKLPVVNREINFIFTGCYTTQSRIKLGNRHGEAALLGAETLDACSALLTGKKYPQEKYVEAWRELLFTHFHDILTGSCVRDSREHAMGFYAEVQATAQTMREKAALNIAEQIDTSSIKVIDVMGSQSEGAGAGYGLKNFGGVGSPERGRGKIRIFHVFNPEPVMRNENIEFTVWDWNYNIRRIELKDPSGGILPVQVLDGNQQRYWDHQYFRFIARVAVPALGYTTVILNEAGAGEEYPFHFNNFHRAEGQQKSVVMENDFIKAEFDSDDGALCSLLDKKTGIEQMKAGGKAQLILNWAEKASNNAWKLGRYLGSEPVTKTLRIAPSTGNTLRDSLEIEQEFLKSKVKTTVYLDKNARSLAYSFTVTWNEIAESYPNVPVLTFGMPLGIKPESYQSDVPAGIQRRPGGMIDYPGLQYTAAVNGKNALAFITDCKYGYRGNDGNLSVTLINSSMSPDPAPERGEHVIRLWITPTESDPKILAETAGACCRPVNIISGGKHSGKLPLKMEMVQFEAASTVLSSFSIIDNNIVHVRVYETAGKKDSVKIKLPRKVKEAGIIDLNGNEIRKGKANSLKISGSTVTFSIPPNKIFGINIKLA